MVIGQVSAIETAESPKGEIYTYVTLKLSDTLYGIAQTQSLVLRFFGGAYGEDIVEVHGSPQFQVGEELLMFLAGNTKEIVPVVGWTQGIFRPCRDESGRDLACDYAGNRVFEVAGNEIVKEAVHFVDAEIVELGEGGGGDTDDGSPTRLVQTETPPLESQALEFASLVDFARTRLQSERTDPQPIVSAKIADFSDLPSERFDGPILDPSERFDPPVEGTDPFLPRAPETAIGPDEGDLSGSSNEKGNRS